MSDRTKLARMVAAPTYLPAHMIEGLHNYADHGVRPGSFLYSILCYDFLEAWHRADDMNREAFAAWIIFFCKHMPEGSFGSRAEVEAWIKRGGENG